MGLWKGKKGSSVFYKITNSNNGQKQGIRERAYEVSNPQTAAQADQRMKLLPAQRIAGALREIVERGWQGVEYGAKSRSAFLSQALKMSSGFPYLDKGDDRIVPGTYQLSKGSISPVLCSFDDGGNLLTDIAFGDTSGIVTWGDMCASILEASPTLNEGDQITFAYALCPQNSWQGSDVTRDYDTMQFVWGYYSLYIDTNDDTPVGELTNGQILINMISIRDDTFLTAMIDIATYDIFAATVIISRDNGNGGYLRSSQKLIVSSRVTDTFNSATRKVIARETYMKSESTQSSDWPVDTDAEGGEGGGGSSYVDDFIALSGLTGAAATANGTQIRIKRRISDNVITGLYFVQSVQLGDSVVGTNGQAVSYTDEMEVFGVSPTMAKNAMPILANAQNIYYR